MTDITEAGPRIAEENGTTTQRDSAVEMLVDAAIGTARAQQDMARAQQMLQDAQARIIGLAGEAKGILRLSSGPPTLNEAIQTNWRGLQDALNERIK